MITNLISKQIWEDRYRKNNESFNESIERVAKYVSTNEKECEEFKKIMLEGLFYPAGRTMSNSGIGKTLTLNNCFTLNLVPDSMEGIFDYVKYGAITQKAGGGTGYNFSLLRPNGTPTSNDAVASGVVSFMNAFDSQTHTVLQGSRRGANMGCLCIYHPDIYDFLESKSWDEGRLTHFNLSVLVDDNFMKAVENNQKIYLRYPCMSDYGEIINEESKWKTKKEVNAKELWDLIITKAYNTGEYGVLYYDNMNKNNNLYYMENIVTTNPCFTGDMKLLTQDGYKTLEELCNTEPLIYSYDGEITKGKVWCNGEKDTIKLKFSNGKEITCTPDHRFMTIDGEECKAKDLKSKKIMPKIYKTIKDDDLYIKLGFIQGDGQLSRLNSESHEGIEVNIGEKDGDVRYLFENDKYTVKSYREIYLQGYNDLLKKFQFSQEILPNRAMPKAYNEWDLNQKANFLQGCFSANGCVNSNKRVSYKTTCKEFATELINTLEKDFGITANLTINKKHMVEFKNGEYECRESYDVNINKYDDILIFAQFIGFYQTYKKIKLNKLIKSRVPYVRSIKDNGKKLVYDFTEPKNHWGIIEGYVAHNCAEYISGILYDDEGIKKDYMGACNLGSLFLHNFVIAPFTKDAKMDYDKLQKVINVAVRMLDNIIDINNYPLKQFENYQKNIRTIGLGITGLADTFAMLNMRYGSEESIKFTDELMNFISLNAYDTSCDLAKEKGSFNFLDKNKFVESNFIRKHIEKYPEWEKIKDKILFYGIRNGRLISVAPAGTLSLSYGNNCSSSLEPIFSLEYDRQIKIGGQDDENIEIFKMRDYVYEKWLEFNSEENIVDKNKFVTAMELSVDDHVNILSTVSYHVDMSCSKTINIPTEYSFEDTKDVYTKCWKNGISGCTIFRPNEIRKGILTIDNEKDNKEKEQLLRGEWEKRPESIIEIRRKIKSGCGSMTLHIGIIPTEKRIFDFYVTNSSKGGCALGIQNLAIAMSHDLRIGGNLKSLEKSFKGAGTCPSYVRAKGKGIEVSKGNSCGASILYCLLDVENDLQEEVLKELVDLNYYNHDKQKEIEENALTKEDLDYIKEYGETAFASRYHKCPECGEELSTVGSCLQCKCGFSKC
jgi:ribonucleoside-diphosphate reductase alpha chain